MADSSETLHFQTIIENYEQLVKELNQEQNQIKDDQQKLKTELSAVLTENKNLSETVQNCLHNHKSTENLPYFGSKTEKDEIIDNLRKQITTTLTEKECVNELWQNCVKTIENLEAELKIFQNGTEEYVPKKELQKLKQSYEEKIGHLEIDLSSTKRKLEESLKHASTELEVKHSTIDQSLETQAGAFKIIKNLEGEVLRLQNRLKEASEDNVYLEKIIQSKDDVIQGLKKRNAECMAKVTEAVNVVEAALNEKDAALFREKELLGDKQNLVEKLAQTAKDYEEKMSCEISLMKAEYSEKIKNSLQELNLVQNELKTKTAECEELLKKIAKLEQELLRIQQGDPDISKLLILEKNLESTFQKLLVSEKQNIQLVSERDSIKNDMEQMTNLYERTVKSKEIETATLNNKIKQLIDEIQENQRQLDCVNGKMTKLNEKVLTTENQLRLEKEIHDSKIHEKFATKIDELNRNHNENIKDLQLQIQTKDENHKKWRTETKLIIENLEKVISNLKSEVQKLKKENSRLKEKIMKSEEKINQYKLFLELISNDVNKISDLTIGVDGSNR